MFTNPPFTEIAGLLRRARVIAVVSDCIRRARDAGIFTVMDRCLLRDRASLGQQG
jgi:hypothetical protein